MNKRSDRQKPQDTALLQYSRKLCECTNRLHVKKTASKHLKKVNTLASEKKLWTHPVTYSGILLLGILSFFFIDRPLALFFHPLNHGAWRDFWKGVTLAGQSEWYLVSGLVFSAWFHKRNKKKARAALFLFSTVAVSGLTADLFKFILGRARPKLFLNEGVYGFDVFHGHFEHAWTSFPSGHSATALSVALTLSLLLPRFRVPLLIGAALVLASRIILCQHYLSDVIAGSLLGGMTVTMLFQRYFHTAFDETRTD